MAEIIGTVAGIAGLVDVAAKISIGLLKIARDIGEAGREIRTIARHTNLISSVLSNLHVRMHHRGDVTTSTLRGEMLVEDSLLQCKEILDDCDRLIQIFQPLIENGGSKRRRVVLRVRMLFEKSRFVAHGDALEKLTGIMTLLVASMNYSHLTHSNPTEKTSDSVRVQLESCITNVEDSCQSRINVPQLLTYQQHYEQRLSLSAPSGLKQESSSISLIDFDYPSAEANNLPTKAENEFHGNKFTVVPQDTKIVEEITEIGSVLSISSLARTEETYDSADEEAFERQLDEDLSFAFTNLEGLLEPYMVLRSLQHKTIQYAQTVLKVEIDSTPDDNDDAQSDVFADARSINSDHEIEMEKRGDDGDDGELEVLRIRDVHGRVYPLPFQAAKTWKGINELLLEIYDLGSDYIERVVDEEECLGRYPIEIKEGSKVMLKPFRVYSPDGNPILPRVWHQLVEPGDLITMRFADGRLNGVGAQPITLAERGMLWARSWWWGSASNGKGRKRRERAERMRFVREREAGTVIFSELGASSTSNGSGSSLVD
ncbi:hypothetical protein BGZ60DRAFT_532023 [Tricladium varicosporioides]|nr:hypothetical protein BGZ60DRAFT_532023 [Hymenoscyphus varicosporioides]